VPFAAALVTVSSAVPGRSALGQEPPARARQDLPYPVTRLLRPPELDGRIDEEAWRAIEPLPAVMHFPIFGGTLTEQTEFRLAYDDEYFYVACSAYDSDPSGILAYSLERDETSFRSDFCSLYLDTLDDEENALQFKTGPAGNRSDAQRFDDGERTDNSWNSFWDVWVSRDETGWYAEFRIPFSSLLYQSVNGRVVMGFSILRNISRKNERHVYPAIRPEAGRFAYTKPSLMRKIVFEGIEPQGMPVYATPYLLGGTGYTHALDTLGTGYAQLDDRVREAGLDARFGLTSNLTLDATVNTDFAQVEADDQQVNLTRFSLFFPEKRRFFQERSSNFEFGLGGQDRLFHSRTIGLVRGQPVRIYGGGRLVGRIGDWDVGFLDLQTSDSETLPSENMGVARVRRRVLNPNSYVGGIFTSRVGAGGQQNLVYGVDGIFRIAAADFLVLNWAQSFDDDEAAVSAGAMGLLDRGVARLSWERRGQDGLTYAFDVERTGSVFDPGLGFLRYRNYTRGEARLAYGGRPPPGARLVTYGFTLEGRVLRRNVDQVIETVEVEPAITQETWGLHQITLSLPISYENLDRPFDLPEATSVPEGRYGFVAARLQYAAPQSARLRTSATVQSGQFFDGHRTSLSLGPVWDPSAHLNLSASYQLDYVNFAERRQDFTTHVGRFRAQVMVSTTTSVLGFVQYSSADRAVVANVRFRYNPREGNDLYLVWNENLVTDRTLFDPVRPLSDARTIVVKYSHTLHLGA